MASLRMIRTSIKSIRSTKQIMRAMQLVSASKFKRAQTQLMQARQMMSFLDGLLQRVLASSPDITHPLCTANPEKPPTLVVVTSDTGLCGAYNTNLIQLAEATLRREQARLPRLVNLGKRGYRYCTARGYKPADAYLELASRPHIPTIAAIGRKLMDQFLSGEIGSIEVLSAGFISTAVSRPQVKRWLPAQLDKPDPKTPTPAPAGKRAASSPKSQGYVRMNEEYIFEPSAQEVFQTLLPQWALAKFQLMILEAFTAEHGARMIAMKNATDNAEELLGSLTRRHNRIRQASITKEISEIVGTAEALN